MASRMMAPSSGRRRPGGAAGHLTLMLASGSGRRPHAAGHAGATTGTYMLAVASGRPAATQAAVPSLPPGATGWVHLDAVGGNYHPNIVCDYCNRAIGSGVRYTCLDCDDFDVCHECETRGADRQHAAGAHVFAKVPDSRQVGQPRLEAYKRR